MIGTSPQAICTCIVNKYVEINNQQALPQVEDGRVSSLNLSNGIIYVLELPISSCKVLGEVKHIDESGSKNRELHFHFANMKPSESFKFGNAACNSSRNSSPEQSTFSTTIFFSPSPAPNKASLSASVVGMIS